MPEAFSINREFDFVRLEGLRRATGLPSHEWDLYIVKELIDNALDADEVLWQEDHSQSPRVEVGMHYNTVSALNSQQLIVRVSNRATFPVQLIDDIFATQWYTSRKAFLKGLTRGALGNALKTLLGIPYALRNLVADDWQPNLKPMSILCGNQEYRLRYVIDTTAQTIETVCETEGDKKLVEGTVIRIGLDHFKQEQPRTLPQLEQLTEQYHLCNPHVEFNWTIEMGDEAWNKQYPPDPDWSVKFQDQSPIQWYPPSTFQEVLGALYRRQYQDQDDGQLSITNICRYFVGFDSEQNAASVSDITQIFGQDHLTKANIESPVATQLYKIMYKNSPSIASERLGSLGLDHIRSVLTRYLPIEDEIFYQCANDAGDDPNIPFVIEVAIVRLKEGKRQIWTALNFTPTYSDPFFRRLLMVPNQPDEPVLGLRGVLDAYGLPEDEPVIFFLHLICPNIEHNEFSKTEINHLPFKNVLGQVTDDLLQTLKQAQEEAELRLDQAVSQALDAILAELESNERFVYDQLLAKLQARLAEDPDLAAWLETPEAPARLRTFIINYESRNPVVVTPHQTRSTAGNISLPLHPNRHISIPAEQISPDFLAHYHISKILYVQTQELEPVVIDSHWLCWLDMALLHNASSSNTLQMSLEQCVRLSPDNVPVLVLHDADEAGQAIVGEMRNWLDEKDLGKERIIDVGLIPGEQDGTAQPTKLVEMMSGELIHWLIERLAELNLPIKTLPHNTDIRDDILQQFDHHLHGHLWEGVSHHLQVPKLSIELYHQFQIPNLMTEQALDDQLRARLMQGNCAESYAIVLKGVVGQFFEEFMKVHGEAVRELVQEHLRKYGPEKLNE